MTPVQVCPLATQVDITLRSIAAHISYMKEYAKHWLDKGGLAWFEGLQ
jgi:hypothetical protein